MARDGGAVAARTTGDDQGADRWPSTWSATWTTCSATCWRWPAWWKGPIYKAIHALQERDVDLAREVIDGDSQIDDEENHIDEECLKILALHQPVAVDLRRIAAAMMINTDLERMGDLAEDIAERALHLAEPPLLPIPEKLQRMTDLTTTMVRQSLDAFVNLDTRAGPAVMRLDDEVDRYNDEIIQETDRRR